MDAYKKPVIAENLNKEAALPVELAFAAGLLTGLASDFDPHPERRRVIAERKNSRE